MSKKIEATPRGGIASALLITLGVLVAIEGLQFLVQGSDYFLYRLFAPRQEAVRREVFEQTKSYGDGQLQELESMELQYNAADAGGRASIRSIVIRRMASYDTSRLPPDLRAFVDRVRSDAGGN